MGLKLTFDPKLPKVAIIAILLFLEGIAFPAYALTASGRLPTKIEWFNFILGATIQVVTYLLAFLGYKKAEAEE